MSPKSDEEKMYKSIFTHKNYTVIFLSFVLCFLFTKSGLANDELETSKTASQAVTLNDQEKEWVAKNYLIRVRVPNYPPYLIKRKGSTPKGIALDYLNLIAERTGIKLKYYYSDETFVEALDGLKNHQGPDLFSVISSSPERQGKILFSKVYLKPPYVIFTHVDEKRIITSINDIRFDKIALPRGSALHEKVKKKYPNINLILFDTDIEAIKAVGAKKADIYIGNLTVTSYLILEKGIHNIKFAAPSPFGGQSFSMGSRNDWPELASIIDKGLASISTEKQQQIRNKYFSIYYEQGISWPDLLKWGTAAGGIVLFTMFGFVFWNRKLKAEIKERKQAEKLLRQSENKLIAGENRYRSLVETQTDLVCRFNHDGTFTYVNEVFCKFFNKTREELLGGKWQPLPVEEDIEYVQSQLASISKNNPTVVIENRVLTDKGDLYWMQFVNQGFFDNSGNLLEIQSVGRNITELKNHEKQIERSLQEKEILLKEIHHRVKNNLQIIQSLLSLQRNTIKEPEQRKALSDSENRIKSMALIHETLYRSENIANLDIKAYFENIVRNLFKIYRTSDIQMDIQINTDPQDLNMDYCIASGLIINELISNALKYAFIDTGEGNLSVSLNRIDEKQVSLIVKDDGCGLPKDFDIEKTDSLGLKIVKILAQGQMKGEVIVTSEDGVRFEINFPISV